MTFSGRIRLYLIAIAVVPPLTILAVTYLSARNAETRIAEQNAADALVRGTLTLEAVRQETNNRVESLAESETIRRATSLLSAGRPAILELDRSRFGIDFAEIVSRGDTVLATAHRSGLVGERLGKTSLATAQSEYIGLSIEYDAAGEHYALSTKVALPSGFILYAGRYIDSALVRQLVQVTGAGIRIERITEREQSIYQAMQPGQLYQDRNSLTAVLLSSHDNTVFAIASFSPGASTPLVRSLLTVTVIVTIISIAAAIGLGVFFTSRTKREIDNLVAASQRVAAGDFDTTVMAYEPGEFAYLADSFSDMIQRLRTLQGRLATSEKIAAWQTVGRKVAHEIKNPLTPIGIAADDLRRSYHEKLPDFDKILDEQTTTIRSEVNRLLAILQEFVDFARMKTPQIHEVELSTFLDGVGSLYPEELSQERLVIDIKSRQQRVRIDSDMVRQLLINLIKNGFESMDSAKVMVVAVDEGSRFVLKVEDDGPGFSEERLKNAFEPYSTTKKDGSGLGLVISHRIVYDHGGSMELYNREEGGAGVCIALPQK